LTEAVRAAARTGRPVALRALRRVPEFLTIWLPLLLSAGHLISFALWTISVSFTPSTLVPVSGWVGLRNYTALMATRNWQIAFDNLLVFGCGFVLLSVLTGLVLAILLDQRIRGENVLRTIYLYPLAVSFVVTGTVWSPHERAWRTVGNQMSILVPTTCRRTTRSRRAGCWRCCRSSRR